MPRQRATKKSHMLSVSLSIATGGVEQSSEGNVMKIVSSMRSGRYDK